MELGFNGTDFLESLYLRIFENPSTKLKFIKQISNFVKIHPGVADLFHAGRQT